MIDGGITLHGIVVKGFRVASGPSREYPYGTLERQIPMFQARGLDLRAYYRGTLNIDIQPLTFQLINPEFTFRHVHWTDLHPPEHFSFSACRVIYQDTHYAGWIYYPHPETKQRHFQNPSLLEVITTRIPKIRYGNEVDLLVDQERITLG